MMFAACKRSTAQALNSPRTFPLCHTHITLCDTHTTLRIQPSSCSHRALLSLRAILRVSGMSTELAYGTARPIGTELANGTTRPIGTELAYGTTRPELTQPNVHPSFRTTRKRTTWS
eukprot:3837623-Rhodomonas_salina.2